MKNLFYILIIMAFSNNAISQQWISLNPKPTGVNLSAVQMFSNDHGYMVGETGTLLEYNGTDWEVVTSFPFSGSMSSMFFLNGNSGWVATYGGSIYHFDGTNWTEQFSDPSLFLISIHLSDETNGWAVGLEGAVVKFNGTDWIKHEEITDATLWTVYCWDESHVWAAGNQELFLYNGTEWAAELEGAPCSFIDFHFNSLTDGTVYTNQALIYTFDGSSWTEHYLNDGGFDDVEVLSQTDIWAVDDLGNIWHSDGNNWDLVEEEIIPNYGSFSGLGFSDATHGWAVGSGGNIYKYDGTEWTRYTEGFSNWLADMDYADENNVWLVGDQGFIYYYNGSAWSHQTCPVEEVDIENVDVLSPDNAWAIAGDWDNYYMLHYDGNEWVNHTTLTQSYVYGLEMINENLGWACAASGDIIKYDGTSWSTFASFTDTYFYNIGFASENDGWAGGYIGPKFYHYDGTAWSEYNINGVSDDFQLNGFKFKSPTEGWAVAREKYSWTPTGWILHYDGTDWSVVLEVPESPFSGIEIINDTLGWAVGAQTYKYNGTEWLPWSDNLPYDEVEGVCFVNAETGWAYGWDGIFYKFNPDFHVGTIESFPNSNKSLNINVFPNPASDIITLQLPGNKCVVDIEFYNLNGQIVDKTTVTNGQVNVEKLPMGLYLLKAVADGKVFTSRVVKN